MEKIYMVPYDNNSAPEDSLCYDGLNFSINEPFLLISSKPIPKHSRVYFEVTISKYTQVTGKRNIPIYAGIHKEPSFGVLNADFCIGSLFYNEGQDFDIMEKYNATAEDKHSVPSRIYSRIPGATDTIGVGVDYDNNLITFYNNGKAFYSFSPSLFKIKDESPFYLCLWGNIACSMKGYVNFGRNGVDYLPPFYNTIYGQYFREEQSQNDILCDIIIESAYSKKGADIVCDFKVVNDIVGDRELFLTTDKATLSNNNMSYKMPYQVSSNYLNDGANVFCNLPIPTDCKVYAEIEVKEGVPITDVIGIPASIGISNSNKTILSNSMRMSLWHKTRHRFTYTETKNLAPTVNQIESVLTSISPEEGKIIGIGLDLKNNSISIYVNKVLLYTFKATITDFTDKTTLYYLFLHDDGVFSNYIDGTFNAGESVFAGVLPDGYISLYDYYNHYYNLPVYTDIVCDINVTPYYVDKAVYIHCDINVIPAETDDEKKFDHPGINKLMNTFNVVTDTEQHIVMDTDITALQSTAAKDNNGYFPEDVF